MAHTEKTTVTYPRRNLFMFWKSGRKEVVQQDEEAKHYSAISNVNILYFPKLKDFTFRLSELKMFLYRGERNNYNGEMVAIDNSLNPLVLGDDVVIEQVLKMTDKYYKLTFTWPRSSVSEELLGASGVFICHVKRSHIVNFKYFWRADSREPYKVKTKSMSEEEKVFNMSHKITLNEFLLENIGVGQCEEFLKELGSLSLKQADFQTETKRKFFCTYI